MSKKDCLQAETPVSFSSLLTPYHPEADIKKIVASVLPISWKESKVNQFFVFIFKDDFPDVLAHQAVRLLQKNLNQKFANFSVKYSELNSRQIKIEQRNGYFDPIVTYFDCAIRHRVIKFRDNFLRDLSDLTYFYEKNMERLEKINSQTKTKWKHNFRVDSIPYKVYFSSRYHFKKSQLEVFEDFILSIRYNNGTQIYPTLKTRNSDVKEEKLEICSGDLLNILKYGIISKLMSLGIIFAFNTDYLIAFYVDIILKTYLLKFMPQKFPDLELMTVKSDMLLSGLTILLGFFTEKFYPISVTVVWDFLRTFSFQVFDRLNEITENQNQARLLIEKTISHYRSLKSQYRQDFYPQSYLLFSYQFFSTSLDFLNDIFYFNPLFNIFQSLKNKLAIRKFFDVDMNTDVINSDDDKVILKILRNTLRHFLEYNYDEKNSKTSFILPFRIIKISDENFINQLILIIENTFLIFNRLKFLKINDDLFYFSVSEGLYLTKSDGSLPIHSDYVGSIALYRKDVNFELMEILNENFIIYNLKNDERIYLVKPKKRQFDSKELKANKIPNPVAGSKEKSDNKNSSYEKKICLMGNFEEKKKSHNHKTLSKINEKVAKINMHLRKKYKKIRISHRPDCNELKVYVSFKDLEKYLNDFNADRVEIKKGISITLYFKDFFIKIFCEVKVHKKDNTIDSINRKDYNRKKYINNSDSKHKVKAETESKKFNLDLVGREVKSVSLAAASTESIGGDNDSFSSIGKMENNIDSIVPELMIDLAEEFKKLSGKEYDFFLPGYEKTYRLWENYILFSYYSYLSDPKVTIDAVGGHVLSTLLQIKIEGTGDLDLRAKTKLGLVFNAEAYFKELANKGEEFVYSYNKSLLKTAELYTVEMPEQEIVEIRLCKKDVEQDILELDLVNDILYVTIDWSEKRPKISIHVDPFAEEFVMAVKKGVPPPLQYVKNFQRAQLLLSQPEIKNNVERMLLKIYPKAKEEVILILNALQSGGSIQKLPSFIVDVALYILNIVFDGKRIFRLFSARDKIKFAENEWVDILTGPSLQTLFITARFNHSAREKDDKNYLSYYDTILYGFKKYFVKNAAIKPPIEQSLRTLFQLSKDILLFDAKVDLTAQKRIQTICDQAPSLIVADPLAKNYYIKMIKPLKRKGKIIP